MNRKTYYVLNIKSLSSFLESIYVKQNPTLRKEGIPLYVKQESSFTQSGNPALAYTEITTEITNNTTLSLKNEKPATANFLSEEEIEELDSRSETGFAEKEPPGSAPPPEDDQPTLLSIENKTVDWLLNDYPGKQKWSAVRRSIGAEPHELTDPRKTVQAALAIIGDFVYTNPKILRNKLLGCAEVQLKKERSSKNGSTKKTKIRAINNQPGHKPDYSSRESWGC